MEKKKIDLDQTIYKLLKEYPELKTTLIEAGLTKLAIPMMTETAGRRVTLRDALICIWILTTWKENWIEQAISLQVQTLL